MGWDRKQKGPASGYYYFSVRGPTGVRKVFCGRGARAHEVAAAVERRKQARKEARKLHAGDSEAEKLANELSEWAAVLSAAWLVLTGHHRHRGCWREKKHG
jgi:hypothetical protein